MIRRRLRNGRKAKGERRNEEIVPGQQLVHGNRECSALRGHAHDPPDQEVPALQLGLLWFTDNLGNKIGVIRPSTTRPAA